MTTTPRLLKSPVRIVLYRNNREMSHGYGLINGVNTKPLPFPLPPHRYDVRVEKTEAGLRLEERENIRLPWKFVYDLFERDLIEDECERVGEGGLQLMKG